MQMFQHYLCRGLQRNKLHVSQVRCRIVRPAVLVRAAFMQVHALLLVML